MVAVVQLVEHQVVILAVAGSSPVSHPDSGNAVCASRRRSSFRAVDTRATPSFIHSSDQRVRLSRGYSVAPRATSKFPTHDGRDP